MDMRTQLKTEMCLVRAPTMMPSLDVSGKCQTASSVYRNSLDLDPSEELGLVELQALPSAKRSEINVSPRE